MSARILVCDDEPYILHAVRMKLAKSGYEVETANDGQSALEAIRRQKPALLITDLQMPRLDGISLCRELRSDPATAGLPIILLTAKGYEIDVKALREELGLSEIMFKPFSPRELHRSAERAIAEANGHSEGAAPAEPNGVALSAGGGGAAG